MKLSEFLEQLESEARISLRDMQRVEDKRRQLLVFKDILEGFASSLARKYNLDADSIHDTMAIVDSHRVRWQLHKDSATGITWSTVPVSLKVAILPDDVLPIIAELTYITDGSPAVGDCAHAMIRGEHEHFNVVYHLEWLGATFKEFGYAALISSWWYNRVDWDHVDEQ